MYLPVPFHLMILSGIGNRNTKLMDFVIGVILIPLTLVSTALYLNASAVGLNE